MGRVPSQIRIQKEDFDKEDQPMIEKLGYPLNSFMEQTINVLGKNVNFENLNQELITLDIIVDSSGIPKVQTQYRNKLSTQVAGITCINASNITSPLTYPTNTPFITYTENNKIITIKHITGLQADNRYQLRIISIGF